MSVILTACRHSKQRAMDKALKKRAEKKRLKREAELMQLEQDQDDQDESDIIKAWTFMMDNQVCCVLLCLPTGKDSVDIYCNEDEVKNVETRMSAAGATFDFLINGIESRITCSGNPLDGLTHILTVDNQPVISPE